LESERLRQFYTKKIENLQKKYQSQLHALKRGAGGGAGGGIPTPAAATAAGGGGGDVSSSGVAHGNEQENDENIAPQQQQQQQQQQSLLPLVTQLTTENTQLLEKINVLEEELLQTAEELGRLKAISGTSLATPASVVNATGAAAAAAAAAAANHSTELLKRIHHLEKELTKLQQIPSPPPAPPAVGADAPGAAATDAPGATEQMIKELHQKLNDALYQIQELKQTCSQVTNEKFELQAEIILLKQQQQQQHGQGLQGQGQESPKMTQFLIMEQKLNDVEGRLQRREKELLKLLEENKMNGNLERMRLQSLHEQVRGIWRGEGEGGRIFLEISHDVFLCRSCVIRMSN
jgi:DNA repair exonuclease SbcCD ATPase subunit